MIDQNARKFGIYLIEQLGTAVFARLDEQTQRKVLTQLGTVVPGVNVPVGGAIDAAATWKRISPQFVSMHEEKFNASDYKATG